MRGTSGLREIEPRLRAAALFPLAAYLVHQLRYLLADGAGAGHRLAAEGHGYLSWLTLPATLLAASAAGAFAAHVAVARREGIAGEASRGRTRWLTLAAALLAVYAGQELLEGLLAAGHPAGLAALLTGGGWIALPASLAVGAVLALLLRAAETLVDRLPRTARPTRRLAARARRPGSVDLSRNAPLALRAAGRAPPARLLVH
jgi:hypothetical protein